MFSRHTEKAASLHIGLMPLVYKDCESPQSEKNILLGLVFLAEWH